MVEVPFVDLGRVVAAERAALDAAFAAVLRSGQFILSKQVEGFERELASACGAREAIGVASGTDAIELALRALGIGRGDEVVTQANTCVPTVAAIERAGAIPVLCDVEPAAATMDPASLAGAIGPRCAAVVPVHLYGQIGDIEVIVAIADRGGARVVEDCAQAIGASLGGRQAGTFGAAGALSFYPTKNLGALGDAGAVLTGDPGLAARLRMLRNYGVSSPDAHTQVGVNSRLDELQAALLRVRLGRLDDRNRRRREIAARYHEALAGTAVQPLVQLPERGHVHHLFIVRTPDRERFRAELARRGIETLVHYPRPIHGYEPYRRLGTGPVQLVEAERLAAEVVSLPLYPELSDAEVDRVAEAVRAVAGLQG